MLGRTRASTAARSLDAPRAIASQNRTRCSRRPASGRPLPRFPAAAARFRLEQGFFWASQLFNVERCDDRLNSPHHRWFIRRRAVTIRPINAIERAQIQLRHRVDHESRQMIARQPITHVRRQQETLIPPALNEILRHTGIVLNGSDGPGLCDSLVAKGSRRLVVSARVLAVDSDRAPAATANAPSGR
jgi:hypothetical protein